MRILLVVAGAAALMGCGGKIASTSEDSSSDTSITDKCVYGEIGRVPGIPFGVTSSDDNTVFVVATPNDGTGASNSEGDLYSLTSAGAIEIANDTGTSIVPFVDSAAFFRLETTTSGDLRATNLNSTFDLNSTPIDVVDDSFVDMSSIAFDGKNKLNWYRWPTLPSSGQPRALPSIASTTAPGAPITTASIDPDVLGVGAFVTDGQHYYAAFNTAEDGSVIGVLPVNGDAKTVLVQPYAHPIEALAVDDTMLIYSADTGYGLNGLWEVPIAGGQSLMAADDPPTGVRPFLRNHNIYWADSSEAPSSTIWELSEIENSTAKVVVTTPGPIFAMTQDSCGIVYTTADDTLQNGIVTRVPY